MIYPRDDAKSDREDGDWREKSQVRKARKLTWQQRLMRPERTPDGTSGSEGNLKDNVVTAVKQYECNLSDGESQG